jgi:hypothetical protein
MSENLAGLVFVAALLGPPIAASLARRSTLRKLATIHARRALGLSPEPLGRFTLAEEIGLYSPHLRDASSALHLVACYYSSMPREAFLENEIASLMFEIGGAVVTKTFRT